MANNTSAYIILPAATCFHLLDPNFDGASQRFTMNLVTAIINIIASPLAVISNSLIVIAILTSYRLRTPSNFFNRLSSSLRCACWPNSSTRLHLF